MNCKEARNLISPYMDSELPDNAAEELLIHMQDCASCRQVYQEILDISKLCRSAGKIISPAPAGFKDAVMQRIAAESGRGSSVLMAGWARRWKQGVASVAAVMLLAFASYTFALPPLIQIAEHESTPPVNNGDNHAAAEIPNKPGNGDNQQPNQGPGSTTASQETPDPAQPEPGEKVHRQVTDAPEAVPTENTPVFLSADQQKIKSVLLKISSSSEAPSAYNNAIKAAQNLGAQTESLGEQVKDEVAYNQVKIVVSRENEAVLLAKLRGLGNIISEQEDYKDISTAYQNTVDQYKQVSDQKSSVENPEEVQRLNSEIKSLFDKLGAFKQQADKVTIVLWLQQ